jgi:hypothetical protein
MARNSYQFNVRLDTGADGDAVMNFKVTQTGVNYKFRMLVPIYLGRDEGKTFLQGRARLVGNASLEQKVPLEGLKTKPSGSGVELLR